MKWIDSQKELESTIEKVASVDQFAIDTEADSFHSYFDKVCLVQISAGGHDVLIDPLARLELSSLGPILENQSIRKLFHGGDYDLRILGRDFGFRVKNLVDTMICAQLLGEPAIGLAALLKKYFGVELDKAHQRADWSKRPLPQPMRDYAMEDTRHLAALVETLETQLREKGRWEWALEEFERLEAVRWTPSEDDGEGWRRLKGANALDARSMELLRQLYEWRDREARAKDVPPFRVISNEAIVGVSKLRPRSRGKLGEASGMTPGLIRRYGSDLLDVVHSALATPESDLPQKQKSKPWKRDRQVEKAVDRLRDVRNEIAEELGIDSSVLGAKHVLTAIAEAKPETVEELHEIEAMRRWQIEVAGQRFLAVL